MSVCHKLSDVLASRERHSKKAQQAGSQSTSSCKLQRYRYAGTAPMNRPPYALVSSVRFASHPLPSVPSILWLSTSPTALSHHGAQTCQRHKTRHEAEKEQGEDAHQRPALVAIWVRMG